MSRDQNLNELVVHATLFRKGILGAGILQFAKRNIKSPGAMIQWYTIAGSAGGRIPRTTPLPDDRGTMTLDELVAKYPDTPETYTTRRSSRYGTARTSGPLTGNRILTPAIQVAGE